MRFLLSLFLVAIMAAPVFAGANIKQKATGATVWEDSNGTQWPAGDSGLMVLFADVSTAATDFVPVHRPGVISEIRVVVDASTTVDAAALDFGYSDGTTSTFTPLGETMQVGQTAGLATSLSPATTYNVTAGGVISIHSDGASTGTAPARIIILVE